jgi:hypothetical protein
MVSERVIMMAPLTVMELSGCKANFQLALAPQNLTLDDSAPTQTNSLLYGGVRE